MEATATEVRRFLTDRALGRKGPSVSIRHILKHGRPFARFRSGVRTGTTPHFALWQADVKLKSALQGTTLASLADRHTDKSLANAYSMLNDAGIRTVYALTQADARDLLAVKGIGPKRLEEVKADLASRFVAVKW